LDEVERTNAFSRLPTVRRADHKRSPRSLSKIFAPFSLFRKTKKEKFNSVCQDSRAHCMVLIFEHGASTRVLLSFFPLPQHSLMRARPIMGSWQQTSLEIAPPGLCSESESEDRGFVGASGNGETDPCPARGREGCRGICSVLALWLCTASWSFLLSVCMERRVRKKQPSFQATLYLHVSHIRETIALRALGWMVSWSHATTKMPTGGPVHAPSLSFVATANRKGARLLQSLSVADVWVRSHASATTTP
jgi:hypothetical protein